MSEYPVSTHWKMVTGNGSTVWIWLASRYVDGEVWRYQVDTPEGNMIEFGRRVSKRLAQKRAKSILNNSAPGWNQENPRPTFNRIEEE